VADTTPVRLLIADESENDAEVLVSLLRNAGIAVRPQYVADADALEAQLDRQAWDLLLVRDGTAVGSVADVVGRIRGRNRDLPVLLLARDAAIERLTTALAEGAADAILPGQEERLLLVFRREIDNVRDRQRRRRAETERAEAEKRCELLLDTSRAAIAYVYEGMHVYANRAYLDLFGFGDPDDLPGVPMLDVIASEAQDTLRAHLKAFQEGNKAPFAIRGRTHGGRIFDAVMQLSDATFDGEHCWQVLIREEVEAPPPRVDHDLLTGLSTRERFIDAVDQALAAAREAGDRGAVLYLSLDDFSALAARIGIASSDLLLADVASVLREAAPADVQLARFGDDSFTALAASASRDEAEQLGLALKRAIAGNLSDVAGSTVQVTACVGVALLGEAADNAREVITQALRGAEQARARDQRDALAVYEPAPKTRRPPAFAPDEVIVERIESCLQQNAFVLLFQPIISLRGESDEHYEVFVRIPEDGDGDLLSAGDFLPHAARGALGGKVDRWVILQSIKMLAVHRAQGHETRLTINLTAATMTEPGFLTWLSVAIRAARMPADALVFQVTEPDATAHLKAARAFTRGLKALHCRTALSRFGGSINPFNTLRHLDIDYVKIDPGLIDDVERNPERRSELAQLIGGLQTGGKLSIVPMVESATLLSTLWQAGANFIQGHYLQEPTASMDYDFSAS
jgi:diguanylate cyclase (GGDEF)-like protein